jgi:hypothetical protein
MSRPNRTSASALEASEISTAHPFEEQHHPVAYWARLWGFSSKTIRQWFHAEFGPGILRQRHTGRRSKRDYITLMISPSAAERVYAKRTQKEPTH